MDNFIESELILCATPSSLGPTDANYEPDVPLVSIMLLRIAAFAMWWKQRQRPNSTRLTSANGMKKHLHLTHPRSKTGAYLLLLEPGRSVHSIGKGRLGEGQRLHDMPQSEGRAEWP